MRSFATWFASLRSKTSTINRSYLRVTMVVLVLATSISFAYRPADSYFEITKNIDIFGKVLREVNLNFVEEVEPNKFVRSGIDAMLKTLDPYTNFISASEIEDYRFISTGQYGGIGSLIDRRDGKILIREPYEDSPAIKAGLRAGDHVIQIDNEVLEGKDYDQGEVRNLLRGQPKTKVTLKVRRLGVAEPLTIVIERDDIKVKNVQYSAIVDGDIAYVDLKGFTNDASLDVKKALEALKTKNPNIKGIVLDLRNNPGGLLQEAINISNLFVNREEKIVETRGRMDGSTRTYAASNNPFDAQIPLAVLINGGSASASEIVSGVVQDLDRGVVVGKRSFGKGLVQTTLRLSYNTQMKVTTARYYTPSGRCIQAIEYSQRDANGGVTRTADSLKKSFLTRAGRKVFDAGGIDPDVRIEDKTYHKVTQDLLNQGIVFDFATRYRSQHDSLVGGIKGFTITDALYQEFIAFTKEKKLNYEPTVLRELHDLREVYKKEKYYDQVNTQLEALEKLTQQLTENDLQAHSQEIKTILKGEIVARYYYARGRTEAMLAEDEVLNEAIRVLKDGKRYSTLLKP
jgi:carboxyl-terminal processing protease